MADDPNNPETARTRFKKAAGGMTIFNGLMEMRPMSIVNGIPQEVRDKLQISEAPRMPITDGWNQRRSR